MLLTLLSDKHGLHRELSQAVGSGDLIIHAGDITEYGTAEELEDFTDWFSGLPFKMKVFIAGNHDLVLEEGTCLEYWRSKLPCDTHYLENETLTLSGLKIWGSPCSPYFMGMAFNKRRGEEIRQVWQKIPQDTDILVTHTPPFGVLDVGLGCKELSERLLRLKPKIHVFGHIHRGYGLQESGKTKFINAALAGEPDSWRMESFLKNNPLKARELVISIQ